MDQRHPNQLYEAFGAYVRSQRELAQLSLRQAAALASISNPYLSQIEHGLALPSITVISALAEALQISAETLLHQAVGMAGGDATERSAGTAEAIRHDPRLDAAQKRALLAVLASYVGTPAPRSTPIPVADARGASRTERPRRRQPPKAPSTGRRGS